MQRIGFRRFVRRTANRFAVSHPTVQMTSSQHFALQIEKEHDPVNPLAVFLTLPRRGSITTVEDDRRTRGLR